MKKFDLSRVAPLALSLALSLTLCFAVVDSIAALGMQAIAALEGSQHVAQPVLAQVQQAPIANAAHAS